MTIRFFLKSGNTFDVTCKKLDTTKNNGRIVDYHFEGITRNKPLDLDLSCVEAVVRVFADEVQ